MMTFPRPDQPDFLRENYKTWGRDYKAKREQNPSASFQWRTYRGERVNSHVLDVFDVLAEHCAFCDGYPLGRSARQTIEHFRPKSLFPRLAYAWANLFPCCDQCQSSKQEKFDRRLLKPDVEHYAFETYFVLNYKTGEIDINPLADEADQTRAKITIEFYGLNEHGRPKSRLLEYRKYRKLAADDEFTLNDSSYRYFLI